MDISAEELKDGFDDWYETALKTGGFKSAEEKAEYLASIGDPLKHPMFATTTEDLIDNPLADALRALREEDKSKIELATMYKDDANALVKKSKTADSKSGTLHEAINTYSFALKFIDEAIKARADGTEEEKDRDVDIDTLKSQIISNRAQVWLTLGNYRSCITDCDLSLLVWPRNAKSHYRKCKALQNLKKFDECISCCDLAHDQLTSTAVSASGSSSVKLASFTAELATIAEIKIQCEAELRKLREIEEMKLLQRRELETKWNEIWGYGKKRNEQLAASSRKSNAALGNGYPAQLANRINFGYCADLPPIQLQEAYPEVDPETGFLCVPILFLYPQYSQLDAIHGAKSNLMLVEYMAEMFPEFEDGATPVEWDIRREYESSKLLVYCPIFQAIPATSSTEWIAACAERRQLQGLDGAQAAEEAKAAMISRSQSISMSSSSLGAGSNCRGFVEVHIGCSVEQILRLPGCVLAGGILTLFAFVKGNEAHRQFIASSRAQGLHLMKLQPNEAISLVK